MSLTCDEQKVLLDLSLEQWDKCNLLGCMLPEPFPHWDQKTCLSPQERFIAMLESTDFRLIGLMGLLGHGVIQKQRNLGDLGLGQLLEEVKPSAFVVPPDHWWWRADITRICQSE